MNSHLIIAVLQEPEGKRIIEIFGVSRVDGECQNIPEVPSALEILPGDGLGDAVRSILNLRFKTIRQSELGKDGVHLGVILSRLP